MIFLYIILAIFIAIIPAILIAYLDQAILDVIIIAPGHRLAYTSEEEYLKQQEIYNKKLARQSAKETAVVIISIIIILAIIIGITAGFIMLDKNSEIAKISEYEAQKTTIESSLNNESLTGLERLHLVQLASELNGEMAYKIKSSSFWYNFYLNGLYDNVELINIGG